MQSKVDTNAARSKHINAQSLRHEQAHHLLLQGKHLSFLLRWEPVYLGRRKLHDLIQQHCIPNNTVRLSFSAKLTSCSYPLLLMLFAEFRNFEFLPYLSLMHDNIMQCDIGHIVPLCSFCKQGSAQAGSCLQPNSLYNKLVQQQ